MNKCNGYSIGQIADRILERGECIREFSGSRCWPSRRMADDFARAANRL